MEPISGFCRFCLKISGQELFDVNKEVHLETDDVVESWALFDSMACFAVESDKSPAPLACRVCTKNLVQFHWFRVQCIKARQLIEASGSDEFCTTFILKTFGATRQLINAQKAANENELTAPENMWQGVLPKRPKAKVTAELQAKHVEQEQEVLEPEPEYTLPAAEEEGDTLQEQEVSEQEQVEVEIEGEMHAVFELEENQPQRQQDYEIREVISVFGDIDETQEEEEEQDEVQSDVEILSEPEERPRKQPRMESARTRRSPRGNRKEDTVKTRAKAHSGPSDVKIRAKPTATPKVYTEEEIAKRPAICNICGLRFERFDYLRIHMRRHTGEKPYQCRYCDKAFPRTTDLNVHERYHTNEKSHFCKICNKGFNRPYNLKVHMRVHTADRPYKCTECSKSYKQSNDLKVHLRKHTGERSTCDICGETFLLEHKLTSHKKQEHNMDVGPSNGRLAKVDVKEG